MAFATTVKGRNDELNYLIQVRMGICPSVFATSLSMRMQGLPPPLSELGGYLSDILPSLSAASQLEHVLVVYL